MFEFVDNTQNNAVIKVIGVGGGGGNAVNHMIECELDGVEFIVANTDAQALRESKAQHCMQLGEDVTKGLGAGANPEVGRKAAEENRDRIHDMLSGADMVFITAGMGGGTGTGAAPIFAEVAKQMGILTVAVVTKPFAFEGNKRMAIAEQGIAALTQHVDSLITIPNNKLLSELGNNVRLLDAFKAANDVLKDAVEGISKLITCPGLINVDFADVRTVMSETGMAMIGTGVSSGENRAKEAAEAAICSPLLEAVNLKGARGMLVNVTAGDSLSIGEFAIVGEVIKPLADSNAMVVMGTVIDPSMKDGLRVTLVAAGLDYEAVPGGHGHGLALASGANTLSRRGAGMINPRDFDRPAVQRNKQPLKTLSRPLGGSTQFGDKDIDFLDIPAFLRREDSRREES